MGQLLFRILDTFWITDRGLVVATDFIGEEAGARGISLRAGDVLELRRPDGSRVVCKIAGIGMVSPYVPNSPLSFLLSREVAKEDVPVGTEGWSSA